MGKLMKYEIKGSYKFILGVLALVVLLTSGVYVYMNNVMQTDATVIGTLFVGLSSMVIFGAMFGTFFYIVNLFRKELYEDRGYLTFTLPLSGREIVGAKLLVALVWFLVIGLGLFISNAIGLGLIIPKELWQGIAFKELFGEIRISMIILSFLAMVMSIVQTLLLIYFSMALGRLTFKNKKISGIWFVIFVVLNMLIGYGHVKAMGIMPQYLNLTSFGIESAANALANGPGLEMMSGLSNGPSITVSFTGDFLVNIGGLIYNLLIMVLTFFGTSYLIEDKIDL